MQLNSIYRKLTWTSLFKYFKELMAAVYRLKFTSCLSSICYYLHSQPGENVTRNKLERK